jgi:hypothetical protein
MKKVIILIIVVLITTVAFAKRIPNQVGLDWDTDGPVGKNWIKVTDIHYLNKNSIKKVKGTIYQARLCNELKLPNGGIVWNYANVRVDCKSRQVYLQFKSEWIGPMDSTTDYDDAVLRHACK